MYYQYLLDNVPIIKSLFFFEVINKKKYQTIFQCIVNNGDVNDKTLLLRSGSLMIMQIFERTANIIQQLNNVLSRYFYTIVFQLKSG